MISRVISGGQTGADRGGLDAAIRLGIPHGGFCPRGRRAEDGQIPTKYLLTEIDDPEYPVRTRMNVYAADATTVFTHGDARQGSLLTLRIAQLAKRPWLHVDLDRPKARAKLVDFLLALAGTLNVAGSRESSWPGIQAEVENLLIDVLKEGVPQGRPPKPPTTVQKTARRSAP